MYFAENDELAHYGTKRHSGRYPWGSGENPYQEERSLLGRVDELKQQGLSEKEIAEALGMTTTELRARKSLEKDEKRAADISRAQQLKEKGMSNVAIGKEMGINESSVRSLLNASAESRTKQTQATVDVLKDAVNQQSYIDVGKGTNINMGITETRLKTAIQAMQDEGYSIHYIKVEQATIPGQFTTVKVLAAPGTPWKEVMANKDKIGLVNEKFETQYSTSVLGLEPVKSLSSKRVDVAYSSDKDGVIELRPGVKDLSLGEARYAQVRIGVDDVTFLKGMAVYSDDLPDGVDVRFNTNKKKSDNKLAAFKTMKADMSDPSVVKLMTSVKDGRMTLDEANRLIDRGVRDGSISVDQDNPFGATIKKGGQKGCLNIVNEEGDWATWDRSLSAQMLSKQPVSLAKRQLDLAYSNKEAEFNEIMSLTNPTIKKHLLEAFSDDLDSSASHLKAAAMPRQASHVILPTKSMKENEIYAPNYDNGEKVVLIRYPHGGTFEIPELTVNNNNREAKKAFQNAVDAVGINPKAAQRLSGADFDGDTVLVIPNNGKNVKTSPALKGLQNFDPISSYPGYPGMPKMKSETTQTEMGKISNLITDMTIKNADPDEIARAVRHSMVVIDAEKHGLNYKQSAKDNNISQLKEKYQGGSNKGAATLISKSDSTMRINERKMYAPIDSKTGKRIYTETGATYINKDGKEVRRQSKSTPMKETDDAFTLSSGTAIENTYAQYANQLKSLANQARKESSRVTDITYSPSARKVYSEEVDSLNAKLKEALRNAPRERRAQLVANQIYTSKKADNPGMDKEREKKVKNQAIAEARVRVGAGKQYIQVTPKEWEAVQAGAISKTKLEQIFQNSDQDYLKQLAMPRTKSVMTPSKVAQAQAYLNAGYTQKEVASLLGVSVSTITSAIKAV
mgnify:CR=1 FL=1